MFVIANTNIHIYSTIQYIYIQVYIYIHYQCIQYNIIVIIVIDIATRDHRTRPLEQTTTLRKNKTILNVFVYILNVFLRWFN